MLTLQEIRTVLMRADYPASKAELLDFARRAELPVEAYERLEALPEHEYGSVETVMDALRGQD